jgi:hypothetical protein
MKENLSIFFVKEMTEQVCGFRLIKTLPGSKFLMAKVRKVQLN